MLDIVSTNPTVGHSYFIDTWTATSEAIKKDWIGTGYLWAPGRCWIINSPEDLDAACAEIAAWDH